MNFIQLSYAVAVAVVVIISVVRAERFVIERMSKNLRDCKIGLKMPVLDPIY